MFFSSVRTRNTFEETVERIARVIKARLLSPGDKLPPERELASQLGVSRSTLRECLHTLCETGYLETRSGRGGGTFVACWPGRPSTHENNLEQNRDQLIAQLDFRRAIEPTAAQLAATRATLIDVAELEGRYYSMVGTERSFELYRARDVRFHVGIAQVANSPLLSQSITEIQIALTEVLDIITYHSERVLQRSNEYHGRILEAIRHREPEEAQQLMLDHLLTTEKLIYAFMGWSQPSIHSEEI